MTDSEKLIKIIRDEGNRKNKGYQLKLGTMTSSNTCKLGSLELDEDDLMISDHLLKKLCYMSGNESKCSDILKKGDTVIVAKMSDETYVIVDKVVRL